MALKIDLRPGEKLQIGDATVTLVQKSGQLASLSIEADKSIPVKKVAEQAPGIGLIASRGIMTA
jgi:hypothetical protein